MPPSEKVIDLVLSASYGILGRDNEDYDSFDVTRAVELLDALGCAHLIRRRFLTLSEGERKRVQIARSMMPDPELLLLDEPAAGLDLGGREDLLGRVSALAADPQAPLIVMVTHHVEEVPEGFTHAMLLRRGAVLAAGPGARGVHRAQSLQVFRGAAAHRAPGRPVDGPGRAAALRVAQVPVVAWQATFLAGGVFWSYGLTGAPVGFTLSGGASVELLGARSRPGRRTARPLCHHPRAATRARAGPPGSSYAAKSSSTTDRTTIRISVAGLPGASTA